MDESDSKQLGRVVAGARDFTAKAVAAGVPNNSFTGFIALSMGMFREIMRCPNDGTLRVPLNADGTHIGCPTCCNTWVYVGESNTKPTAKKRKAQQGE